MSFSAWTAQGSRSLPGCMRSASQSEGKYQRLCGQERKWGGSRAWLIYVHLPYCGTKPWMISALLSQPSILSCVLQLCHSMVEPRARLGSLLWQAEGSAVPTGSLALVPVWLSGRLWAHQPGVCATSAPSDVVLPRLLSLHREGAQPGIKGGFLPGSFWWLTLWFFTSRGAGPRVLENTSVLNLNTC